MGCSGNIDISGIIPIVINILDIALTIIGLIPEPVPIGGQVSVAADVSTVVLNVLSNDPIGAVLSTVAVVPVAGISAGTLKIIYKLTIILTYLMGSPLLQVAIASIVLGSIIALYYFIYFL